MRQFLCIFISCFCLALPLCAQSNKMIKELESKRGALQKQIAESETLLNTTKKDVGSQLNGLAALTGQIEERKRYILAINNDMETIDRELSKLERQLVRLENDLTKEFKGLVHGDYGKTPAPISAEFTKKILGDEKPITCRFADTLAPEMDKLKAEAAKWATQEEDVLTYAMFPQVAPKFFEKRNAKAQGVDADHADFANKSHPV